MSKFLDTSGLQTLWGLIKGNFIAKSSVSAKSTTLSFGAESEIAEIDGKKIKVTLPANPNTNTARLQVSDTSNKRINTLESTGSYIQFLAGTNKFTVSDGTSSFDVGITPSISLAHTITVISGKKKDGSTDITATSSSATNPSVTLGDSGATAGAYGPTGDVSGTEGATIKIPYIRVNSKGIVTEISEQTLTTHNSTYNVYNGSFKIKTQAGSSAAVEVAGTSANTSNNSDVTFVQGGNITITPNATSRTITIAATDTTYTAGTYLALNGTQFYHKTSGVSSGSYGPASDVQGNNGATISVPYITVDAQGHITSISNKTFTAVNSTYTVNNGSFEVKTKVGDNAAVSVSSTSANTASNSSITFIQGGNISLTSDTTNKTITIAATDTTYTAGTYLNLSGTQFSHKNSGATAGTYGPSADVSGSNGATISVPQIKVDAQGHITEISNKTFTAVDHTYTVNNGSFAIKTKVGSNAAVSVGSTSANASGNTDVTFIQGTNVSLTSDTTNRTITIAATDTTYTAGTGLTLSGTQFKHSNSVTAGTAGTSSATSGSTLAVPYITYDAEGHITVTGTHTHTITGFLTSHQTLTNHAKLADTSTVGQAIVSKSGGYEWKTLGGAAYKSVDADTMTSSSTNLPTAKAVAAFVSSALTSVLTYKGTIGSSGATITALPASHKVGDTYVVSVAGTYAGKACEVGDYIICKTAGTSANDAHWDVVNGENQVENKSASLASAGSSATIATVDGTNLTITTPNSWTGVTKTGTITKVGNTSSGDVSVSSSNNTASWGDAVTVGSVGGVDLKFTMPGNPNSNTTYTFESGTTNGAFKVTPSGGSAQTVSIYGLGTAAYTNSDAYAAASHSHSYVPSSTTSNIGLDPSSNYIGYVGSLTKAAWNYNQSDGAMYTQFYSASWKHEIFADYRTGHMSVRGKNNGTWQNWYSVFDMGNVTAGTNVSISQNATTGQITISSTDTNTAKLKVSDTTNNRIANTENTGNYVQFTGGSNKFTVSDGTNSFEVPITISGYATSGHTHTTTIAADSGTSALNMAANTTYKLTAGGTTFIFKTPADSNTWRPVGTGASDAAAGNHTHTCKIEDSTGTSQKTLAYGGKYAITAGGDSFIFTMPSSDNTNTWRPIQVGGVDKLTDSSTKINFTGGGSASVSYASGTITISCSAAANATADSALSQSEIAAILV